MNKLSNDARVYEERALVAAAYPQPLVQEQPVCEAWLGLFDRQP